jgi:transposase
MKDHKVTHVAMESTGVFWKPIWNILESDFELILVNAQHIKQVPGRKTDVRDCEWIAQLLQHGLLPKSFVPSKEQRELRDLTRLRTKITQQKTAVINRIQKVLEDANIKLASVVTDILGVSGRAMLEQIIIGQIDPDKLSELAKRKLRGKIPELKIALNGKITDHHRFILKLHFKELKEAEEIIEELDIKIGEKMRPFEEVVLLLMTIPGIGRKSAENIIAEIGVNMEQYPSSSNLASWTGICPGNNESAGKKKSEKTRKGNRWLRVTLCESAWGASRTKDTYLSAQYKRLVSKRGKKRAVVAVGHTLLTIIYHMIKNKMIYHELGKDHFIRLKPERYKNYHIKKLEELGFIVTLEKDLEAIV